MIRRILAVGGMLLATATFAGETLVQAAVGRSAAIVALPRRAATAEPPQIVVTVVGYTPSRAGPVQAVVTCKIDGVTKVLGRFGVFPDVAFDASEPAKAQLFGFPLPAGIDAGRPLDLEVKVEPTRGSGDGALLVLGAAEID